MKQRFLQLAFTVCALGLVWAGSETRSLATPQKPHVNTGKIDQGKTYASRRGFFSITVPPAGNPFVRTYALHEAELKEAHFDYEDVVFHIPDFGQAFAAGVRRIPAAVLAKMAQEDSTQTLSNLAGKALFQWRDYAEEPQPVDDTAVQTQFGSGLLRVYLAKKSSIMTKLVGVDDNNKPKTEKFDTYIVVLVVKQGDHFIYATAEDDYLQINASSRGPRGPFDPIPRLKESLQAFFATMKVKK